MTQTLFDLQAQGYRPTALKFGSDLSPRYAAVIVDGLDQLDYLTMHDTTLESMLRLGLIDHADWIPYWLPTLELDLNTWDFVPGALRDISAKTADITRQIHGQFTGAELDAVYTTEFRPGYGHNVGYRLDGSEYKHGAVVSAMAFLEGAQAWMGSFSADELPLMGDFAARARALIPNIHVPEGWLLRAVGLFIKSGVPELYLGIRS